MGGDNATLGVIIQTEGTEDSVHKFGQLDHALEELSHSFTLSMVAGNLMASAITKGLELLKESFSMMAEEAMKAELNGVVLNQAFKDQGALASDSALKIMKMAEAQQNSSRFSHDEIEQGVAKLKMFSGLSAEMVEKLTPAILDMAAGMGVDAVTAFQRVGMGIENGRISFGRFHVALDTTHGTVGKVNSAIEVLNSKFGGQAAAQLNTTIGQWDSLKNSLGSFLETLGGGILKLTEASGVLHKITESIRYWTELIAGEKLSTVETIEKNISADKKALATQEQVLASRLAGIKQYGQASEENQTVSLEHIKETIQAYKDSIKVSEDALNLAKKYVPPEADKKKNNAEDDKSNKSSFDEWVAEENRKWAFEHAGELNADADELSLQEKHAEEMKIRIKKAQEEVYRIKRGIDDRNTKDAEKELEKIAKANEEQAARLEQSAQAIGIAIASGIGKGAEGLKDSLKAILNVLLSAVEKELLLGVVGAGARALIGDYSGLIQIAGITAAFEAAKAGIGSFQTPEGGERIVPGAPNVASLAIVHGRETIGRKGGSGSGHTFVVQGNYFESEKANERLFNSMYKYTKKNGLKFA